MKKNIKINCLDCLSCKHIDVFEPSGYWDDDETLYHCNKRKIQLTNTMKSNTRLCRKYRYAWSDNDIPKHYAVIPTFNLPIHISITP